MFSLCRCRKYKIIRLSFFITFILLFTSCENPNLSNNKDVPLKLIAPNGMYECVEKMEWKNNEYVETTIYSEEKKVFLNNNRCSIMGVEGYLLPEGNVGVNNPPPILYLYTMHWTYEKKVFTITINKLFFNEKYLRLKYKLKKQNHRNIKYFGGSDIDN